MSFWDAMAVAGCLHPRWLDDGPDEMGERVCAVCEERVVVALTAERLVQTFRQIQGRGRPDRPAR